MPHFLAALDGDRSTEFQYILEALYFLHSLVDEAESLKEEAQFTAIVATITRHLEAFLSSGKRPISTQRHFELAVLSIILALRDKDMGLCMTAIQNLQHEQIAVVK